MVPSWFHHGSICFTVSQGFDFLYLTEADYQSLPAGAVIATLVPEVGYALEAVVGLGCRASVATRGPGDRVTG